MDGAMDLQIRSPAQGHAKGWGMAARQDARHTHLGSSIGRTLSGQAGHQLAVSYSCGRSKPNNLEQQW